MSETKKAAPQDSGTAKVGEEVSLRTQCKGTDFSGDSQNFDKKKNSRPSCIDLIGSDPLLAAFENHEQNLKGAGAIAFDDDLRESAREALALLDRASEEFENGFSCSKGQDGGISDEYLDHMLELYESMRIIPGKQYRRPEAIMTCFGKTLLTRAKLSVIKGQTQSKKTQFCRALAGAALAGVTGNFITATKDLRVLYIDTEQGEDRAALSRDVIAKISGKDNPQLEVFSFVQASRTEELKSLAMCIGIIRPDLAIVDGIADIMFDSNDKREAEFIKDVLLKLANKYDCCICSVIHTNPTKDTSWQKAKGHIGTELQTKADTEMTVTVKADSEYSVIEISKSRDDKPCPFSIRVDNTTSPAMPLLYPSVPEGEKDKGKSEKCDKAMLEILRERMQMKRADLGKETSKVTGNDPQTEEKRVDRLFREGKIKREGKLYYVASAFDDESERLGC